MPKVDYWVNNSVALRIARDPGFESWSGTIFPSPLTFGGSKTHTDPPTITVAVKNRARPGLETRVSRDHEKKNDDIVSEARGFTSSDVIV